MKKEFTMPIIALSLICLFVSGVLAIGHSITQPIIAAAAAERAAIVMREIMPDAEFFEPVELPGFPAAVRTVYRTTNNVGYIFIVATPGFGGDITFICAIGPDGRIIRTAVLSHSETPTFAAPVFAESHAGQFWGQDRHGAAGVSAISGATITANAYRYAVLYAFAAFEHVRGTL